MSLKLNQLTTKMLTKERLSTLDGQRMKSM